MRALCWMGMKGVFFGWMVIALAAVVLGGCGGGVGGRAPHAVAPQISGPLLPSLAEAPAEAEPAVELGRYAPDFTLPDMNGKSATLSDWRGKLVLLNFWASWCAPCRQEMPLLQATHEAYADDGLVVLSINMKEEAQRVESFVEDMGLAFTVLLDEGADVAKLYRVRGAPTTYFIDREGVIRQRHVGPLTTDMLASILSGVRVYPHPSP